MRQLSLGVLLFAFWLTLSGHYTPLLMGIGLVASILCVALAVRMNGADHEAVPIALMGSALSYWPWLVWEICKSAWSVSKIILSPRLPISPTMTVVAAGQQTPVGIATYANSITLTPGTITTGVRGNLLTVHALVRDGADDLEGGGMDARVTQFEGAK
ncbi:MAG: Na+/H+ antiporter subunit E [Hyphomicrobiaceae bacterium]